MIDPARQDVLDQAMREYAIETGISEAELRKKHLKLIAEFVQLKEARYGSMLFWTVLPDKNDVLELFREADKKTK